MGPGTYDLKLYRGDTFKVTLRLWADTARTEPVDLTGASVASEIRDKSGGPIIIVLDCVVTLPNVVDVTLDADGWIGVPAAGVWDVEVTFPGPIVQTVVGGKVIVLPDVTNSVSPLAARHA